MWTMVSIAVAVVALSVAMSDKCKGNSWKFDALCEVFVCAVVAAGVCWFYGL